MKNPIYKCPHCKEAIEVELTKSGQLLLQAPSKENEK